MNANVARARRVVLKEARAPQGFIPEEVLDRLVMHVDCDVIYHLRKHFVEEEPPAADHRIDARKERAKLDRSRRLEIDEGRAWRWIKVGLLAGMGLTMAFVGFISFIIR